jgi:CSLREA domain-containing protein
MRPEPRSVGPAATFVVNSVNDSPLATPTSKRCVDAEGSHPCSLRAAVQAANNLDKPVLIKLAARTYKLSDSVLGALTVTNAGGTSIEGAGAGSTKIEVPVGDNYGVFYLETGTGTSGASLVLTGVSVSGGTTSDGAGIDVGDDPNLAVVLDKVTISGNHATTDGGAFYCEYCNLWATDSSLSGNTSGDDGGAIYTYLANLYLTDDRINSNTALDDAGGAIFQEYGNTRAVGGSFSYDTAGTATESGDGGAFYDEYGATYLSGVTVSHDAALNDGTGGAGYEYFAALTAAGVTYSDDRAVGGIDASGGALYIYGSGHDTLSDVTMSHDTTSATTDTDGGGAIFDYGYELGNSLTISQNSSFTDNGSSAICLEMSYGGLSAAISDTTFKANTSSLADSGAAVRLYASEYGGINLTILSDKILDNVDAGTFSAGGVEAYADTYATATMRFDGDTVNANTSRGSGGAGGIQSYAYEYSADPLEIDSSVLEGNHAPDAGVGGAVSDSSDDEYDNPTLTLTSDVLSHNSAGSTGLGMGGDGGAVAAVDYVAVSITSCTIADNTASGTAAQGALGGGVYDASYAGTAFNSDVVTGNRSTGRTSEGGGIWTSPDYGGGLLDRSTISANDADQGAGLYIYYYTLDVESSTISKNLAGGSGVGGEGGGIYDYEATIAATNSTFADNLAQNSGALHGAGGAIYDYEGSSLALYYATVSGNAAQQGAAIFTEDGSGTLRDSIVASNHTTLKGKTEADCHAAGRYELLVSTGGNVLSRASCVLALSFGDDVTAKPGLLVLASNGGPTETMALAPTSPAVNAAHGDCPSTDQRGIARPKTGRCDSGAYQRAAPKK